MDGTFTDIGNRGDRWKRRVEVPEGSMNEVISLCIKRNSLH